jgi:hypothetical protein
MRSLDLQVTLMVARSCRTLIYMHCDGELSPEQAELFKHKLCEGHVRLEHIARQRAVDCCIKSALAEQCAAIYAPAHVMCAIRRICQTTL